MDCGVETDKKGQAKDFYGIQFENREIFFQGLPRANSLYLLGPTSCPDSFFLKKGQFDISGHLGHFLLHMPYQLRPSNPTQGCFSS